MSTVRKGLLYLIKRSLYRNFWSGIRITERPPRIGYAYAVLFIILATLLKLLFFNFLSTGTPFLLYYGAVVLAARFGGLGPAIFTAVVTGITSAFLFVPPYDSFQISNSALIKVILYMLECLLIVGFTGALIKADFRIKGSERRFKALIEKSHESISLAGAEGKILYASPSIVNVLGYTPEEFRQLNGLERLHPDEAVEMSKKYFDLVSKPGSSTVILHRYLNKHNEWLWIETTLTNLLEDEHVKAVVSNFRNVTERILLEKQKDDFIGIATHELKTPVTSIKAYAQIMLSRFKKEENFKAAEIVEKMENQLNKLIGLITDLLDVTKIQSGILPFKNEPYDFNQLIQELVTELQPTTDKHDIEVRPGDEIILIGDKERVGQVLVNLISNAIKYSPTSSKILIHVNRKNDSAEVCVEDYGVGISKEVHAKVFERFYRVSGPGNQTFPGLGLGLYISAEIIKRQGGKIWVQSEKGKGSTFCFSLPLPTE